MSEKKTADRLTPNEAKMAHNYAVQRLWAGVVGRVFKYAAVVFAFYWVYASVAVSAGKSTDFKSVIEWGGTLRVTEWAAYAIAALCGVGYWRERKARRKLAEQTGPRLSRFEQMLDPERTTSGLTPAGDTPPGEGLG